MVVNTGAAWALPASSEGISIVSPADRSQLPAAGNGTVLVELRDRLEMSSLRVVLVNTATGLTVDLTSRLIKGERATKVRNANRCAYRAVLVFRQAYKTANSADLLAATRSAINHRGESRR